MKRLLIFLFLLIIVNFVARAQQDPQFSQNMFNHLTINPGFAGKSDAINASLLNRFQWVGFPGAPVTTVFNADATVGLIGQEDGIGFSVMNDEIGYEKNISVSLMYAWRTDVGNGKLGTGISIGLMNKNLKPDWSSDAGASLIDQGDPLIPQSEVNALVPDVGLGLYYETKDYYLGLSVKHLNQAVYTYEESGKYSLVRNYYFSGGYNIRLSDPLFEVQPSLLFKTDAASYQVDLDVNVRYDKRLWGGLGYRLDDAVIVLLGTEFRNGIKLGYSYDLTISPLARYSSGSHEFFVAYSFNLNRRREQKYKSVRFL